MHAGAIWGIQLLKFERFSMFSLIHYLNYTLTFKQGEVRRPFVSKLSKLLFGVTELFPQLLTCRTAQKTDKHEKSGYKLYPLQKLNVLADNFGPVKVSPPRGPQ